MKTDEEYARERRVQQEAAEIEEGVGKLGYTPEQSHAIAMEHLRRQGTTNGRPLFTFSQRLMRDTERAREPRYVKPQRAANLLRLSEMRSAAQARREVREKAKQHAAE